MLDQPFGLRVGQILTRDEDMLVESHPSPVFRRASKWNPIPSGSVREATRDNPWRDGGRIRIAAGELQARHRRAAGACRLAVTGRSHDPSSAARVICRHVRPADCACQIARNHAARLRSRWTGTARFAGSVRAADRRHARRRVIAAPRWHRASITTLFATERRRGDHAGGGAGARRRSTSWRPASELRGQTRRSTALDLTTSGRPVGPLVAARAEAPCRSRGRRRCGWPRVRGRDGGDRGRRCGPSSDARSG